MVCKKGEYLTDNKIPPANSWGVLNGVRVIDLTQILAGPFCTAMLADQGADVIKIEPTSGDLTRTFGPHTEKDEDQEYGGYFASVNRNKRGLALDLKNPQGKEIIFRLIENADVLVENFRAGVMDRLGLSYETLHKKNPKLVYATVRGFGDPRTGKSPYVAWPAFDIVAQAMGGMMGITGSHQNDPTKVGPGVGDLIPAMMLAFGIVAALRHAERTGQGQFVDVAMLDGVLAACERIIYQHSVTGKTPVPEGNRHPLICPFGMVKTKDGWITLAAQSAEEWRCLCELIGRTELVHDQRFTDNKARIAHQDYVYEQIEAFTSQKTRKQLVALFGGKIPFGPVYDINDILEDDHYRAREMIISVDRPHSSGSYRIAGVPVRMTETPGGIYRRAPLLGEHTDEILNKLGLSQQQIKIWRDNGVIK